MSCNVKSKRMKRDCAALPRLFHGHKGQVLAPVSYGQTLRHGNDSVITQREDATVLLLKNEAQVTMGGNRRKRFRQSNRRQ